MILGRMGKRLRLRLITATAANRGQAHRNSAALPFQLAAAGFQCFRRQRRRIGRCQCGEQAGKQTNRAEQTETNRLADNTSAVCLCNAELTVQARSSAPSSRARAPAAPKRARDWQLVSSSAPRALAAIAAADLRMPSAPPRTGRPMSALLGSAAAAQASERAAASNPDAGAEFARPSQLLWRPHSSK